MPMHGLFRWSSKWWPGVIPLAVFWAIAAWIVMALAILLTQGTGNAFIYFQF